MHWVGTGSAFRVTVRIATYETAGALATTGRPRHTVDRSWLNPHAPCSCMPRLFIALNPSDLQRAALHQLRTDAFPARWTPPEQYHLTLRFLGDTPPDRASALKDALADFAAAPCPMGGTGLGTFPSLRKPRVLYACVNPAPALMELQTRVDALCTRLGFAAERHSFTPHLTVARLRKAEPTTVYRFVRSHAGWTYPLHMANRLTLYKSRLRAGGALHTAVARTLLRE